MWNSLAASLRFTGERLTFVALFSSSPRSFSAEAPMRFSSLVGCLTIVAGALLTVIAVAQESSNLQARMGARRELELAKDDLRYYWQVEYPCQRRQLNGTIELVEAEVRNYQAQLREMGPYGRFSSGQPFLVTLQNVRMCLRDAELRLQALRAERNVLVRFHSDRWRELELRIYEARLRVLELEPKDDAEDVIIAPASDRPAI